MYKNLVNTFLLSFITFFSIAQDTSLETINEFIKNNQENVGIPYEQIGEIEIVSSASSLQKNTRHVYVRQRVNDLPILNGLANFSLKNGQIQTMANRLVAVPTTVSSIHRIEPSAAVQILMKRYNVQLNQTLNVEQVTPHTFRISRPIGLTSDINIQKVYYHHEGSIHAAWQIEMDLLDDDFWWSTTVDAQTGNILFENNWVSQCNFTNCTFTNHKQHLYEKPMQSSQIAQPDQYTVFALPLESPNHGNPSMVVNPADSLSSPFGWHDTNGSTGAEYTITRGNNVHAYEDADDDNAPGYSPDGGSVLEFNFAYNPNVQPSSNQDAAITNLFYMNNMMHDIWYRYGFDEASGNFQETNYSGVGQGGDYVRAEAQDGGGTNNANFATPPEGNNPRMQMYLWTGGSSIANILNVNSPSPIAGSYQGAEAGFGPGLTSPITADLVLLDDGTAPDANDGCEAATNGTSINGKIAILYRGNCTFVTKVISAQNAGAVAVIVVNNQTGSPFSMGGTDPSITIPSVMISDVDGATLINSMSSNTVNVTLNNTSGNFDKDGDFDNGIIAHEYGHGISTRLTGGSTNSNCLNNEEQMGEGWSDWFGLMLTIEPGDQGSDIRGIGTYANGESTTGNGIRPAPYSTNFGVNPYTYGNTGDGNISVPHGVGFIYCTVLWDMTWELIDFYGGTPDMNLYSGTGGNNVAMALVTESLKLQPCNPGMLDGRDAILQADQLLYGGAHRCVIWEAFANRGFGFSASQGSASSRTDQVEAFDLPPICQVPTNTPTAAFNASELVSCNQTIQFTDSSFNVPQTWLWDFGDGFTDTVQNPSHTYASSGVYTVKLVVGNIIGSDSTTLTVTITLPPTPYVADSDICLGDSLWVTATGVTGATQWYNSADNFIQRSDSLLITNVGSTQTFYVRNVVGPAPQFAPPADNTIGSGGYHVSGYHGALNFTAQTPFTIKSAWVDAQGAGPRTIVLASGTNTNGAAPANVVQSVTVNLQNGPQRVTLDLEVPAAGDYNIGGSNVDLYRNNGGANYPYVVPGVMTINNSSATTNPVGYYYYLYDIEVQEPQCLSSPDTFTVQPFTSNFTLSQNLNTVSFTSTSVNATAWNWDFGDGNTSTLENPVHTYASAGTFTVTLYTNGDASCTYSSNVTTTISSTSNLTNNITIDISPNPVKEFVGIQLGYNMEDIQVRLYSSTGQLIRQQMIPALQDRIEMDMSTYPSGLYSIQLSSGDKQYTEKIIKE